MPTIIRKTPPAKSPRIDWDQFHDGRPRACKRGVDFTGSVISLRNSAYQAAKRCKMQARTWMDGEDVNVQFVKSIKPKRLRSSKD